MYREVTMKTIEDHIQHDKELIADPNTSEPMKRHATEELHELQEYVGCLLYTSPSPRDNRVSRMPSSA